MNGHWAKNALCFSLVSEGDGCFLLCLWRSLLFFFFVRTCSHIFRPVPYTSIRADVGSFQICRYSQQAKRDRIRIPLARAGTACTVCCSALNPADSGLWSTACPGGNAGRVFFRSKAMFLLEVSQLTIGPAGYPYHDGWNLGLGWPCSIVYVCGVVTFSPCEEVAELSWV